MKIPTDPLTIAAACGYIILLAIIIVDKRHIKKLKQAVEEERHKRLTPFLNLAIDRDLLALRLVNEGATLAQNITIDDVPTLFDVGFQKKLLLRFEPIDCLRPGDSRILNIEILENEKPLPAGMLKQIGGVLLSISFKAYVHCQNMNGVSFCTELIKEGPTCRMNAMTLKNSR